VLREHRADIEVIRLSLREQESPYGHVADRPPSCAQTLG
jgi:hypothetical protein